MLPAASDVKPLCPSLPSPVCSQTPEKWQQAFWNSLKSAPQKTRPAWGLGFLEVEGRAVRSACTVCSSAMTQFAVQPALVHTRPTNTGKFMLSSKVELQSSQLVQHISVQQAKASYFPAMLPKAVELKQSCTLPGPPPYGSQNRSQLKKKALSTQKPVYWHIDAQNFKSSL